MTEVTCVEKTISAAPSEEYAERLTRSAPWSVIMMRPMGNTTAERNLPMPASQVSFRREFELQTYQDSESPAQ